MASSRKAVLVVDDNQDAADSLAMLLEIGGHEVTTAYSAPDALKRAPELKPAVILLDLGLPGIDGCEVARRMRAMPELQGVRLVALTGYGRDEDRQRTRDAGFDHHLVKPVDLDELEKAVAN
jgi:two-component system, chemotaxis family, CheB/CheR fusion protein